MAEHTGASRAGAEHAQDGLLCRSCRQPWPCHTVCWERMQATVALHQETEYRYEDDADAGCTVCGVISEWPCPTVATLTGASQTTTTGDPRATE